MMNLMKEGIDEVPYKSNMDELIDYLNSYEPGSGKQVVILVDEELPNFTDKMANAKQVTIPIYYHMLVYNINIMPEIQTRTPLCYS